MRGNYRADRILALASELQPGDVDRLNKILEETGLGRPLRLPALRAPASTSRLTGLTVTGADPMAIRDAVQAHVMQDGDRGLPQLVPDVPYNAGTVGAGMFLADGKKSGHGIAAWLPAPANQMPARPPWPQTARHQVIALLDSGVQPHDWLPAGDDPPFVVNATEYGWAAPDLPGSDREADQPPPGSHWGHATFLAGLIRMTAPDAQILSMRVMNAAGQVSDDHLGDALTWLAAHQATIKADIVLMAFGRRREESEDRALDDVRDAITRVADNGVRIVASAGNDGSAEPVYPAAFAADPGLASAVVSVGALSSPTRWAPFSDYGPWVREARKGTGIVSLLPELSASAGQQQVTAERAFDPPTLTVSREGFAWWSGTSFAAAIYAGQLASQLPGGEGLPVATAAP